MTTFSQRFGFSSVRSVIQKESADEELRNQLWNGLYLFYFKYNTYELTDNEIEIVFMINRVWVHHYKARIDELPKFTETFVEKVKNEILDSSWFRMYDLLEAIPNSYKANNGGLKNKKNLDFIVYANKVLERCMSAYRFVDGKLAEITTEEEITAIEEAISGTSAISNVQKHIKRALELMTDRENPDYRNSVKESISGVESIAKLIVGDPKATLASAINRLKSKIKIHRNLEEAFKSLYSYTSEEGGIRHALTEHATACDFEDAKFMLVICSTFVNYLQLKADKANIIL